MFVSVCFTCVCVFVCIYLCMCLCVSVWFFEKDSFSVIFLLFIPCIPTLKLTLKKKKKLCLHVATFHVSIKAVNQHQISSKLSVSRLILQGIFSS